MMNEYKPERHDLIYLTPEGKTQALYYGKEAAEGTYGFEIFKAAVLHVPGIVMRQTEAVESPAAQAGPESTMTQAGPSVEVEKAGQKTDGRMKAGTCIQPEKEKKLLRLGFSWHERSGGVRMRFSSMVEASQILRVEKPWDVVRYIEGMKNEAMRQRLELIREAGTKYGVIWGIFGSCAMEMVTGYPYMDENSDLDIIAVWPYAGEEVRESIGEEDKETCSDGHHAGRLHAFYGECKKITGDMLSDMEILFPGIGSVKAAEWFSGSELVMIKNLSGAQLAERQMLAALKQKNSKI